ncbi:hypothetical protein [Clostridium uliginosum]|uniref:Uncharacterized protein n=1 Tax=Clostridium uliginosum TaxID=119641 RepID=A0A1I1SWR0_9CLOT|nr:hypothetical protein [Clostridium uliginosum]SFD49168.1 hypothetical protein SAMN05421842_1591 [Clostridium uliginosum]
MGTSASLGYTQNRKTIEVEVSSDGYPSGIGVDVIESLKRRDFETIDLSNIEVTDEPEDYVGDMSAFQYDKIMGDSGIMHSNRYIINLDKKVLEFHGGGYGIGTLHLIKEYPFQEVFDIDIDDIVKEMEYMEQNYYDSKSK